MTLGNQVLGWEMYYLEMLSDIQIQCRTGRWIYNPELKKEVETK